MQPGSYRYLPYLRCFESVARCGSLRAAAMDLSLSPGAVSLQLKKLSHACGLDLFVRDGRRLVLSPDGRTFHDIVRRSLADLDRGAFGDGVMHAQPDRFRLSVPPSLGMAWLTSVVIDACRARGIISVTVSSGTDAASLDWAYLDMAVVYDQPPFKNLWWSLLREARLRTVCAPNILLAMPVKEGSRTLFSQTLLHEDEGQEWTRWSMTAGVLLDGTMNVYLPSIMQAVRSAMDGQGLALVSDTLVGDDLRHGDLVQPFTTMIPGSRAYYFISRPSDAGNRLNREMRTEIVRALQRRVA